MNSENPAKIYVNEIKRVSSFLAAGWQKKRGGGNETCRHYIIENKWGKFSVFRLAIKFLKQNEIQPTSH